MISETLNVYAHELFSVKLEHCGTVPNVMCKRVS